MKLKYRQTNVVSVQDWDDLVCRTYNRPYSFQQQDGCKERGTEHISVPCEDPYDYENDTISESINGDIMGVSFGAWLARDPNQKFKYDHLWWARNFYPCVDMIVNDLHSKGLLDAGEYVIDIDW